MPCFIIMSRSSVPGFGDKRSYSEFFIFHCLPNYYYYYNYSYLLLITNSYLPPFLDSEQRRTSHSINDSRSRSPFILVRIH
uniref:Uncharacterized protein n=1 Tax=Picea glauca TaxID=3330 RepID=A0A117NHE3_PICGL|nr:hypothetical protein ABT39_MTgene5230 [Picea glauca]